MGIDKDIKEKIISVLTALLPEAKIYLFGSRARGVAHEWSDIDLAIDVDETLSADTVLEAQEVLSALHTPYKVEVVNLATVSPEMRQEILRDRIIWKA